MKKLVLNIALFAIGILIASNSIKAQEDNVKASTGVQIGLEATPQFSYLLNSGDMDSPLHSNLNFFNASFGVSGQCGFTENIGVGLNVLYSIQGSKYEWKDVEYTKNLQYLKIPLMLTLSFPVGDKIIFLEKIGPQFNILLDATLLDKDGEKIIDDFSDAFENFDLGIMLSTGIGYKIDENLSIDMAIRFDYGFTNAENEDYILNIHNPSDLVTPAPATSPRETTNNTTVGLNVGIRYSFL